MASLEMTVGEYYKEYIPKSPSFPVSFKIKWETGENLVLLFVNKSDWVTFLKYPMKQLVRMINEADLREGEMLLVTELFGNGGYQH